MNKKKFASVGIFIAAIAIGAGIAYYVDPTAINNIIGINAAQVDTISDGDLLAVDSGASSSLAAIDPDAGADATAQAVSLSPSSAKKSAQAQKKAGAARSGAATAAAVQADTLQGSAAADSSLLQNTSSAVDDLSDDVAAAASSSTPASASTSTLATPCLFPESIRSATHEVIFNEIAWMGSLSSSAAEWMEIKNSSANEVDLSGWEILNASGKIKITFSTGDALAPGGLLLLARGSSTPAEKTYSGDLVNTGDVLALMDPQCGISDYLDASNGWPDGNNTTKQTLERDADGVGWHTSALPGGTPGAKNSVVLAPTLAPSSDLVSSAPEESMVSSVVVSATSSSNTVAESDASSSSVDTATSSVTSSSISDNASAAADGGDNNASVAVPSLNHILIAVVQIAGVGTSSSNDLVKLYNPTAAAIDISGWKLHKKSGTGTDYSLKVFPAGSVIGAGQPFVWANSGGGFSETIGANVSSTETLAADNSVALMDAAGTIVDAVAWGTGTNQYGEGPPYPTSPGANQLLSRRSSDGVMVDTDNNSNDFTIQ